MQHVLYLFDFFESVVSYPVDVRELQIPMEDESCASGLCKCLYLRLSVLYLAH